jgi:hypothetical protein
VTAGANPVGIKKGIDKTCAYLVQKLAENAKPIRGTADIKAVASISAGNDEEIGAMIAGAIETARAPRRGARVGARRRSRREGARATRRGAAAVAPRAARAPHPRARSASARFRAALPAPCAQPRTPRQHACAHLRPSPRCAGGPRRRAVHRVWHRPGDDGGG